MSWPSVSQLCCKAKSFLLFNCVQQLYTDGPCLVYILYRIQTCRCWNCSLLEVLNIYEYPMLLNHITEQNGVYSSDRTDRKTKEPVIWHINIICKLYVDFRKLVLKQKKKEIHIIIKEVKKVNSVMIASCFKDISFLYFIFD